MEFHRGRLIDHLHLRVANVEASAKFYRAILTALGKDAGIREGLDYFNADELWIDAADGETSRAHLAFQAIDHAAVHRFYEAALEAGGKDNGEPGERHYHPGYYAAFVLDPDGNNIEAVYHGPVIQNVESVVIQPDG